MVTVVIFFAFSMRFLRTNKDPHITTHHFVEFLQELQGVFLVITEKNAVLGMTII